VCVYVCACVCVCVGRGSLNPGPALGSRVDRLSGPSTMLVYSWNGSMRTKSVKCRGSFLRKSFPLGQSLILCMRRTFRGCTNPAGRGATPTGFGVGDLGLEVEGLRIKD
jgi:hypothetical protein